MQEVSGMLNIVLEKRLPLWTLKEMMVLPEKSYPSKKLYSTIGMSYHQLGKPTKMMS